ncbi:4-hydroxy-tetrahydrodipicolinate reductase [Candidiatus Paracoxiella cheracis]|uniref:4-hydroxy-tetrahydrodipicolinate reductase n=1 Tax=Candidiatus Paracoxiella cheracis TaxID=3405120 RepID=UPI003BF4C4AD
MSIKVIVNGVRGKMGAITKAAIEKEPDLELAAGIDRDDDLAKTIEKTKADVVVDFTTPQSVFTNAQTIIAADARPVIGTTGLTMEQVETLQKECQAKKLGGIIAPNFSIGAVLMMKYAEDAARYFHDVEIIEMHHQHKLDAPSGTAIKTAQMIRKVQTDKKNAPSKDRARGDSDHGAPIHSVRLPGLFSTQSVIFGDDGQLLTIRHDGLDRNSIMPGVILACHKVMQLDHLVYGLETIL